jgi:hypothetical protein
MAETCRALRLFITKKQDAHKWYVICLIQYKQRMNNIGLIKLGDLLSLLSL